MQQETPVQFPDRRERPRGTPDRRRSGWREFRHAYPGLVATMTVAIVVLLVGITVLLVKRDRYAKEIARLRAAMTEVERERTDALLADEERRFDVMLALLRRQAKLDHRLHLAVSVDSGRLVLQRDGAVLRSMPAEIGTDVPPPAESAGRGAPARGVSAEEVPAGRPLAAPRGSRTVERVLAPGETYPLPAWMREARPEIPANAMLDDGLLLLAGGLIIYPAPDEGPLAPPSPVLPGAVRVPAADFAAMRANLTAGMTVYFY